MTRPDPVTPKPMAHHRYRAFEPVTLPERTWPGAVITETRPAAATSATHGPHLIGVRSFPPVDPAPGETNFTTSFRYGLSALAKPQRGCGPIWAGPN